LSTIGVKYGKEELIRSILSPSAAIGFSFRSVVAALSDGRVVTGLPVEETADRLVLKTAEGERVSLATNTIEERRTSDVSLMPEGLAQTMTDQELVDLIAYLATLKEPVSIVGQYQAVGPVRDLNDGPLIEAISRNGARGPVSDGRGVELSWRRVTASAEGQADLMPLLAGDGKRAAYVWFPVVSPVAQKGRLVIETPAEVTAWLDGKPVSLAAKKNEAGETRSAEIELPEGTVSVLLRLAADDQSRGRSAVVTTIVANRPVGFNIAETGKSATPAGGQP
jgi:putative heme-binding domain-containing protein